MLIAVNNSQRIDARDAARDMPLHCPVCKAPVILRRGRKVIAHFAHRPEAVCDAHCGETRAHLDAKRVLCDAFRARGLTADVEVATLHTAQGRRADVMVWSPGSNIPVAIELQNARLPIPDLETRAASYARAGIAQLWVPFLDPAILSAAECRGTTWRIERYSVSMQQLWIAGLSPCDDFWMYDPERKAFWKARLAEQKLMSREAVWYEMGAVKTYRQGGERRSRRFRTLWLEGPWHPRDLRVTLHKRSAASTGWFNWPGCMIATFVASAAHTNIAGHRPHRETAMISR